LKIKAYDGKLRKKDVADKEQLLSFLALVGVLEN